MKEKDGGCGGRHRCCGLLLDCFVFVFFFFCPTDQHAVRAGGGQGALFSFFIVTIAFDIFDNICLKHKELSVNLTRIVLFDSSGEHFREHEGRAKNALV